MGMVTPRIAPRTPLPPSATTAPEVTPAPSWPGAPTPSAPSSPPSAATSRTGTRPRRARAAGSTSPAMPRRNAPPLSRCVESVRSDSSADRGQTPSTTGPRSSAAKTGRPAEHDRNGAPVPRHDAPPGAGRSYGQTLPHRPTPRPVRIYTRRPRGVVHGRADAAAGPSIPPKPNTPAGKFSAQNTQMSGSWALTYSVPAHPCPPGSVNRTNSNARTRVDESKSMRPPPPPAHRCKMSAKSRATSTTRVG
jgi:hypothetical protein